MQRKHVSEQFEQLLTALVDEPALVSVRGTRAAQLAVPDGAQAPVLASMAHTGNRKPILVVTPTTPGAERLAADLSVYLGAGVVDLFPAWETLPFERVSPGIDTMGQRVRTLSRLQDPEFGPQIVVAPVRALLQRIAPGAADVDPIRIGVGDIVDPQELVADLVALGYRRDPVVEHRGELAVRGSIVDVYPSTGEAPIRIDMWGDEVDRISEFSVADQRSTTPVSEVELFACRELIPGPEVANRAEELIAEEPWGREQWQRLADGEFFEGMESWMPWLAADNAVVTDLLRDDAHVVLIDPQQMRRRASDLLEEEADLARALSVTWGASETAADEDLPRLHVTLDRVLERTDAPLWTLSSVPESPTMDAVAASGWNQATGEDTGPVHQVRKLMEDGYTVTVTADGAGSAPRIAAFLSERGVELAQRSEVSAEHSGIVIAPLAKGSIFPNLKLAVLSETELTGRRRAHRRRRAPRRRDDGLGLVDDLKPGTYVVHPQHGVARYSGMVTRAISGVERDYLLLEYRGNDKLYLPSDQIDTVRQEGQGQSPGRRAGSRPGAGGAVPAAHDH